VKVVRKTEEELFLVDRAVPLRILGGFFVLFASFFLAFADRIPFPAVIFPWIFLLIGAAIAILPRNTMIRFDRERGEVTIDRIGTVLPRQQRTIPLDQIHTVDVQEQRGSKGGSTYRVRLLVTEGEPVNFTEYSSSGRGAKEELAETVRTWLGGFA
jgi:hypothetical protein